MKCFSGLLSNQGEKSIHFYFRRVPLRKKVLKYGTPKPRFHSRFEPTPPEELQGFEDLRIKRELKADRASGLGFRVGFRV